MQEESKFSYLNNCSTSYENLTNSYKNYEENSQHSELWSSICNFGQSLKDIKVFKMTEVKESSPLQTSPFRCKPWDLCPSNPRTITMDSLFQDLDRIIKEMRDIIGDFHEYLGVLDRRD